MPGVMPTIFFGHGNPMNALLDNSYTQAWQHIGQQTTKPRAISQFRPTGSCPKQASPSAPPQGRYTISAASRESCIAVQYPAPGDPDLARRVQQMLAPLPVPSIIPGDSTMARGQYCVTCIRLRISRSCS